MIILPLQTFINEIKDRFGFGNPSKKESGAVTEIRNKINSYYHNIVERDPDRERFIIVFIIIYIIILIVQKKRFYWWYPSFNLNVSLGHSYPDSQQEIEIIMREYILKRMPSDASFFRLTDVSPAYAFEAIISPDEMSVDEMERIMTGARVVAITRLFKLLYNRARPSQIAPDIINKENGRLMISETADTPSYPSGHALQSYYLARILSRKFPAKTKAIMDMAAKCANVRIMAGLHYPSDRDFAWWIVDNYLVDA
jgi:hypothetical protein